MILEIGIVREDKADMISTPLLPSNSDDRNHVIILCFIVIIVTLIAIVWEVFFEPFPWHALGPDKAMIFFRSALLGSFVICVMHTTKIRLIVVSIAGGLFEALLFFIHDWSFGEILSKVGWGLGVVAIVEMLIQRLIAKLKH